MVRPCTGKITLVYPKSLRFPKLLSSKRPLSRACACGECTLTKEFAWRNWHGRESQEDLRCSHCTYTVSAPPGRAIHLADHIALGVGFALDSRQVTTNARDLPQQERLSGTGQEYRQGPFLIPSDASHVPQPPSPLAEWYSPEAYVKIGKFTVMIRKPGTEVSSSLAWAR